MKRSINKEEKFIINLVIITAIALAIILPAREKVNHQLDEAADSGYEAGYQVGMEEAKNNLVIYETYEIDGDTYITIEFPDGSLHEYVSPKALG